MMRHAIGLAAAISATVAFWALAPAARADAEADCRQRTDRSLLIRGCTDVIRRDPKAAWAFWSRAYAHADERDYDRAIADFSAAIELEPRDTGHYHIRGLLYLDGKRDYDRALADFNEHVRLNQAQGLGSGRYGALAFASRGRAYFLKGDADRGIADFRKAFEQSPESFSTSFYYPRYDDYKRVATELSEAIRLRPDEALLYAWRGEIHDIMSILKGTKRDRAIADFSAAVRLDPTFHWAYAQRAEALHASGDHERAIADLSEAIRLKPDEKYYDQRSVIHRAKGDYDRAIADLSEVINLRAGGYVYYGSYERRGDMYRTKGDYDRAIADYDRVLATPDASASRDRIFSKRAKTYFLKDDCHRAIADYSKAIEVNPKQASHYDGRAWAYLKAGKAAQGLPDAERALQLSPRHPRALNTRGHILEALGKREQAIADFREALRLDHALQASQEALKRLGAMP